MVYGLSFCHIRIPRSNLKPNTYNFLFFVQREATPTYVGTDWKDPPVFSIRFCSKSSIENRKIWKSRDSRSEVLCRKGVLRNFTKFTGKHLCQWHRCFTVNFVKFLRNTFFTEHLRTIASEKNEALNHQ